jgi:hypothetical protein
MILTLSVHPSRGSDLLSQDRMRTNPPTPAKLASCKHVGVKLVCIPQRGGKRTTQREAYESSAAFRQGQRFRAGIEGRISVLFRGRGMKRCLAT